MNWSAYGDWVFMDAGMRLLGLVIVASTFAIPVIWEDFRDTWEGKKRLRRMLKELEKEDP